MSLRSRSRSVDTDQEEANPVGCPDYLVTVEHDRGVGPDGDAAQSRFRCQQNRAQSDRRPVGAGFLTGLPDLYEHAARAFAAQRRTAPQQLVGPLYRLDAENEALLNDGGLADIERAQGPGDAQPTLDIGLRLRIWAEPAERSLRRERPVEQLIGAQHPKTLLFELLDHRRQETVIAQRAIADPRKQLGRAPIGPQCSQRGPPNAAGQHQLGHLMVAQHGKPSRRGTEPAPGMRDALYRRRLGCSFESKDKKGASGGAAAFDELARQGAASGHDPEPIRHPPPSADRWPGSNRRG